MLRKLSLMIFVSFNLALNGWPTLSDLDQFVSRFSENPAYDNKNPLNPEYQSFYRSSNPTWYVRLLSFFKLRKLDWPLDQFDSLLEVASKEQEKNSSDKENIVIDKERHFVVFGDLLGDFHSFVRNLHQLKKLGIIDEFLSLKKDYYLVFLGNILTGVHSIELLTVIFYMMDRNSGRVILLKGAQESDSYWRNFSTADELKIKYKSASRQEIPFAEKLDSFFDQLSPTLSLHYKDAHNQEAKFLFSYSGFNGLGMSADAETRTQICSENPSFVYRVNDGLDFDIPEQGVTTWKTFACPDKRIQGLYKFYYDAFLILDTAPDVCDWALTLYRQDVRKNDGYKEERHNVRTGKRITEEEAKLLFKPRTIFLPKIEVPCPDHGDEIVVGCTLDLSSTDVFVGERLAKGLSLAINKQNVEHGGVRGKFLRLVILNDEYRSYLTKQCMAQLSNKFKTNVLLVPSGTSTLKEALPIIKKYNLLGLFPYSGAEIFRNSGATNFINLRSSFKSEIEALVNQASTNLGIKRFAIFYIDDAYGRALRRDAKEVLERNKISDVLEVVYKVNTLKQLKVVERVVDFNPDAIFFFINQYQAEEFIRHTNLSILSNVTLMGTSMMPVDFSNFLSSKGLGFMKTEVVPDPILSDMSIIQEYKKDLVKYMPEEIMTTQSLEAYIDARLFISALESVSNIDQSGIRQYFETMKDVDFNGLKLSFNSDERQLAHYLWLNDGKGKWLDVTS